MNTTAILMMCALGGCGSTPNATEPDGDAAAGDALGDGDAAPTNDPPPVAGPDDPLSLTTPGLYALPQHTYEVDHLAVALDTMFAEDPSIEHVILYVHGRACGGGGEPTKSLAEVMPPLEADYHARALMLYWPGSDDSCPLGFPEDRARAAGPALAQLLTELATYRQTLPSRFATRRLTLITHSLGNIVLEAAAQPNAFAQLPPNLVDTVVVSSSATALADHAAWLERVTFSPHVYVPVNDGDNVLTSAGVGRGTRLGRRLEAEPLTGVATYVDFTASNVNHRYFIVSGQEGAHMKAFYQAVMTGHAYDFTNPIGITNTEQRGDATIYTFDGQ